MGTQNRTPTLEEANAALQVLIDYVDEHTAPNAPAFATEAVNRALDEIAGYLIAEDRS